MDADSLKKTKRRGRPENLTNAGKGRPKGCKNKFTDVKTAFLKAFEAVGHEEYVRKFASKAENQRAFLLMIARLLPHEHTVANPDGSALMSPLAEVIERIDGCTRGLPGER
jgi:hypothetical protein